MHSQPGWRDDYGQINSRLIAEGDTIDAIADQLDMLVDDVADILARTHPLGPVLQSWAARSARLGAAGPRLNTPTPDRLTAQGIILMHQYRWPVPPKYLLQASRWPMDVHGRACPRPRIARAARLHVRQFSERLRLTAGRSRRHPRQTRRVRQDRAQSPPHGRPADRAHRDRPAAMSFGESRRRLTHSASDIHSLHPRFSAGLRSNKRRSSTEIMRTCKCEPSTAGRRLTISQKSPVAPGLGPALVLCSRGQAGPSLSPEQRQRE